MSIDELNSYGYDRFIGRVHFLTFGPSNDNYVELNLHTGGSTCYYDPDMEWTLRDLCTAVKNGERVLLNKSPGSESPKTCSEKEMESAISGLQQYLELPNDCVHRVRYKRSSGQLCGRQYLPFTPDEMAKLEAMYERRTDMKRFQNPFLYQPE